MDALLYRHPFGHEIGNTRRRGPRQLQAVNKFRFENGENMFKRLMLGAVALSLVSSLGAFAGDDVNGIIKTRTGETLVVTTDGGTDATVVLTETTRTVDKKGLFGLEKQQLGATVLIPGLKVSVKGTPDDQGRIVAKEIVTDGDDLEASQMIQAGLTPTADQVAKNVDQLSAHNSKLGEHGEKLDAHTQNISANQQEIASNRGNIQQNMSAIAEQTKRFNSLTDFDVKGETTVNFAVGSSKVSKADIAKLNQLAQTAKGLTGYIVEVTGFTDSTGSAATNTKLSEDRAKQVVTLLQQQGGIPIRHIVAPGAMGEYGAKAPNEKKTGRAENRRVEVKVLVNKGLTGA
jgi:OmpA-OmpF porin, OOP family